MPDMLVRDKQLPTPPPEGKFHTLANGTRAKHVKGASSGSTGKRLPSSSSNASVGNLKRTAYGSERGSMVGGKKVDVNDDLIIRLLAHRAFLDAQNSYILSPEEVDELKNEFSLLNAIIESTSRKLTLEQKVKQAARSLYRLENAASKRQKTSSSASSDHLDTAQRKCDEISAELWRLSSQAMDVERKLLNHNAAVLGLGMSILERKAMESGMTDEFGEGHLYLSNEDGEAQPARFSISEKSVSAVPSAEVTEAQNRLRELNAQLGDVTGVTPTPADGIISHIEQLEENIRALSDSHSSVTQNLQTSLSESQRMIEHLQLRERDQTANVEDHAAQVDDLERRMHATQKEHGRVQTELEEQFLVIKNLNDELQTAREEARIAETAAQVREAESLRREKSLRRGESERFQSELALKEKMIADLQGDLDTLLEEHESTKLLAGELQSKLDEQTRQHDTAVRDLETQLVMLKSETAMLKAEKDQLLGSRQQRAEEARLHKEMEQQREKNARNSQYEQTVIAELEQLKNRNSQLVRDLEFSESERLNTEDTLTRQIVTLEKQMATKVETVTVVDRSSYASHDNLRERELESRCEELQTELSSILDDFERLTSQFIDHESFRQTLESQIDGLRSQCHNLQTELAEEKVRHLGRNGDPTSPVAGGMEATSTGTLRTEFRKMVAELRNEHIAALKVEYDERRKLEATIRELKKEKDRERYTAGRNGDGK